MILLYNIYLDDKIRIPGFLFRGLYRNDSHSVEVFKYTLSSVVDSYNWKKVIINVEFADSLQDKKEELFSYIKNLFKKYELILSDKRCGYQSDWKKLYEILDDDLIYFCCNHDHVFIDDNTDDFKKCVDEFRSTFSQESATLYFSHWPEVMMMFLNSKVNIKNTFAYTNSENIDSIQIITKKTYHQWWFTKNFESTFLPRTDYFGYSIPYTPNKYQAVPYKEYFKHYDGYTHITPNQNDKALISNISSPLFIPNGFFDNNIKINIGYEENIDGEVNINLSKKNYTVIDKNGTDLKIYKNEIPFFWKNKITKLDVNPIYNEVNYKHSRDSRIVDQLVCGYFHGRFTNSSVVPKIKEVYKI